MLLSAVVLSLAGLAQTAPEVMVRIPEGQPALRFAAQEIVQALKSKKITASIGNGTARHTVTIRIVPGKPESFRIENARHGANVIGGDPRGAMYGALDVAEQIKLGTGLNSVRPQSARPSMPVRMYKFNIPLPGVGYASEESLKKNKWFYDLNYWRGFLTMMARDRYNALSLWSAHPYDRMLRLSKYPEACALSDAELAKNQKFFHALFQMAKDHGVDIYLMTWNIHVSPAFAAAHKIAVNGANSALVRDYTKECVRELLTQYPEITGLGTCPGEAMGGLDADGRLNWIKETYFEGIKEAVDGRRFAVGGSRSGVGRSEVRGPRSEASDVQDFDTLGIVNRKSSIVNPTANRQPSTANENYPPFILRYWGGTPESTDKMLAAANYPGPVYLDIKYNGEHVYSSTKPHVQDKKWQQMAGRHYQLLWHLRNDDLFTLRWGEPEFARELLGNVVNGVSNVAPSSGPHATYDTRQTASKSAGFVMGSEIEIPGEDYIHTDVLKRHVDWKYEFEKQWFRFMLWGRLGYNLNEPESTWSGHYSARFGKTFGPKVYAAMKTASKILPQVTAFHWNYMNGDWYPEGNVGPWNTSYEVPRQNFRDNKIFHSIDEWVWNNTIDVSLEDIPTYVMRSLGGANVVNGMSYVVRNSGRHTTNDTRHPLSPIDVATRLADWANEVESIHPEDPYGYRGPGDDEWDCTRRDLQCLAELGRYYSQKIFAATSYCRFLLTGDEASRTNALDRIQKAAVHWKRLAKVADLHYIEHEVWLQGQFSWGKYIPDVERDVQIVKNAMPIPRQDLEWRGTGNIESFYQGEWVSIASAVMGFQSTTVRRFDEASRPEIRSWLTYLNNLPDVSSISIPTAYGNVIAKKGARVRSEFTFEANLPVSRAAAWQFRISAPNAPKGAPLNLTVSGRNAKLVRADGPMDRTFEATLRPGEIAVGIRSWTGERPYSIKFSAEPMPWRYSLADLSPKDASKVTAPMSRSKGSAVESYLHIPKGSGRGLDLTTNKLLDNGRAEFPVEIREAGKHVVHAYVNWPDTAGNSFYIEFDQPFRPTPLPPVLGNDDVFEEWHWVASPAFDLKAGQHTLTLRNREEGAKVARLVVAKQEGTVSMNNDDGGDLLTAEERNDFFHAIYERMTAVKPLSRFKTKAEWQAFAKQMRPKILNALGLWPLPKKVALDPHNSKKLVRDGYTVERVWYQVFPKVYASAYLYIPDAAKLPGAKLPAILHPHGHWDQGAADPVVQSRCIAMAKMGYVSLCPDSTHVFDFPTGLCPVGQMTWDNIRALDYLESLPYVDRSKLGCTGASGGGQQTMYLGAVDDRVKVLVPAVMVCYFRRILFEDESAHHFCNHVPGIAGLADQTEMAAMFAPRPTLFICATGDWTLTVPKEEFPDMKHIWDLTGGDTQVVQFDKPHNYDQDSREQMYAWFNKYLKGDTDPAHAKEPPLKTEDPNTLKALSGPPAGMAAHEGAVDYYRKTFGFKEPVLKTGADVTTYRNSLRPALRQIVGFDPRPSRAGTPRTDFTIAGLTAERWFLQTSTLTSVPAWYFPPKPGKAKSPGVVIAHPGGKRALLAERPGLVQSLVEKGIGVIAVDVRQRGELKREWRWDEMIWGMPEMGMAATDLDASREWLGDMPGIDPKQTFVVGIGDLGIAALLSAALDPGCAGVAMDDIGLTYTAGRETPDIPGLLRYADLPQIAALAAPKRLWINGAREPFWFTRNAYKLLKADKRLQITTKHEGEFDYGLAGWVLGK